MLDTTLQDLVVLSYGDRRAAAARRSSSRASALVVALRRNVLVGRTGDRRRRRRSTSALFAAALRDRGQRRRSGSTAASTSAARSAYLYSCRVARNEVLAATRRRDRRDRRGRARRRRSTSSATRSRRAAPGSWSAPTRPSTRTRSTRLGDAVPGTDGIVVDAGSFTSRPGHVRITGNRVHDRAGTGIALRTAVQTWMVKENVVDERRRRDRDRGQGRGRAGRGRQQPGARRRRTHGASAAAARVRRSASCSCAPARPAVVGNTVARVGLKASRATRSAPGSSCSAPTTSA